VLVICPTSRSGFSLFLLVIQYVRINYVIKHISLELLVQKILFVMRGIKINYTREIDSKLCSNSLAAVVLEMSMVMRETAFSR
jgi:hypothetical protein